MDPISLGAIGTVSGAGIGGANAGFWSSLGTKLLGTGVPGLGAMGKLGGGTLDFLKSSGGGAIGSSLLGGLTGDEEESELEKEKAQSERETRRWEEKNAAPTAGIGQYLMRSFALQGYPVLGAINNLDFLFNKVVPYLGDYGGQLGQNIEKSWNQGGANIGRNISKGVGNLMNWRKR